MSAPLLLNPQDVQKFTKLGISTETLAAAGVRRVSTAEAKNEYGINSYAGGGIIFPYRDPLTGAECVRMRRDGDAQPKYLSPKGKLRTFFFPPGCKPLLDKMPPVPVTLVEAEKSSLALWDWSKRVGREIVPIALGGVWGWRGQHLGPDGVTVKKTGVLPDLAVCKGRVVNILFDANPNDDVEAAREALTKALRKLKAAEVLWLNLPLGDWNGPDDFIGTAGDTAMAAVFDNPQPAPQASASTEFSEDALAETFTAKYGDEFKYTATTGHWHGYDGKAWAQDETGLMPNLIRTEVCRPAAHAGGGPAIASARTISAVERIARCDSAHATPPETWDANPWLLNTPGGTVDLRTGELRPHRREDFCTKMTAVAPGGDCPLWLKFLDRVTASDFEQQTFLQRITGYFLTGDTSEQAFFFAHGHGANGKSVYETTITGVLGDYSKNAPAETFMASAVSQHPTDLASLQGARLVMANETESGRRWAEARVKALCSGEPVTCRFMRGDFFTYVPTFKLMIVGNHRPALRSVDEAIRRRMRLVPFTVTIPESERDHALPEKLRAEWPGILAWAIAGCLAWQRDGLNPPAAAVEATDDYLSEESAVGRWIEERCTLDSTNRELIATSELFDNWKQWSADRNEFCGSIKSFSQSLESITGVSRDRTAAVRGFRGIKLRGGYQAPNLDKYRGQR